MSSGTIIQEIARRRERRRWSLFAIWLGLLTGIGSTGGAPATDTAATAALAPLPAVQPGIEANEQAFLRAVLAQDVAGLNALLADDFVYVHENGLISTKAQFLADFVAKGHAAVELKQKEPARQYGGTVFTVSTGHLQLNSETPYPPPTAVQEDGEALLDRTMILYGSNMNSANSHATTNLPIIFAGGGFRHGQHLGFDKDRNYPLPNLFVSMLQRLGIEADKSASATGTMRGLQII